jgi:tRNA (uracil-5-)-methyltransferase
MKKKRKQYISQLADRYRGEGVTPPCPHFGQCGGCLFQDIPYEAQCDLKRDMINDTLEGIAAVDAVRPSEPYRYRSRMDMVTAFGKCGLRRGGSYRVVVDVESCRIMREKSDALFQKTRSLVLDIEGYDYLRHQGYLRYVVIREAAFTGQVMVNFVTAVPENRLSPVIEAIAPQADSVSLIHSGGIADLSYGGIFETVKTGYIEEDFEGIRYRVTPNSFFQSNAGIAIEMYRRIRSEARGRVLDLCAGVGSISLFIAGSVEQVTGVEMNPEAVETACVNREINGIANAEFVCAEAREFLRDVSGAFDTVVLDPPRTGMMGSAMERIDSLRAGRIIYMSCNPATFRDDVAAIKNYRIESLEAFDMFPQTPHVELLGILKPV